MMTTLVQAQSLLGDLGVKSVKFMFKRQALDKPMSELELDLAGALSRFHEGEATRREKLPSEDLTT